MKTTKLNTTQHTIRKNLKFDRTGLRFQINNKHKLKNTFPILFIYFYNSLKFKSSKAIPAPTLYTYNQ
ncbi:hypothetical protein, partial [Leptospira borgpetersenii]|uniref:hypothetical protein n=1 Tax=Leptospira borgpetersenii TaxID=174 RepID=UPI0027DC9906